MTFEALAAAGKDQAAKDIILSHAAACIFAPQETGYSKSGSGSDPVPVNSLISLIARSDKRTDGAS